MKKHIFHTGKESLIGKMCWKGATDFYRSGLGSCLGCNTIDKGSTTLFKKGRLLTPLTLSLLTVTVLYKHHGA